MESNPNPYLIHSGESLSFALSIESAGKAMVVNFPNGESKKIEVRSGRSSILGALPSACGNIIYCLFQSGKEKFYNTLTGKEIPGKELVGAKVKFHV